MKLFTSVLLTLVMTGFIACNNNQPETPPAVANAEIPHDSLVAKGKYLVTIMGCNDCHSPKIFDEHGMQINPDLMLSGHPANAPLAKADTSVIGPWLLFSGDLTAFVGPWGISYA